MSKKDLKKCGLVMPISATQNCSEQHWVEVRGILEESIRDAGFEPNLVSEAADVGVIQKRIVQNLFENPIVVVDISERNANVMLELGMRLAFDKATIIIKDKETPYSFDTSPVEHLEYPRGLRFQDINDFKEKLTKKIESFAVGDWGDSFLKSFGSFKSAKIDVESVPAETIILEEVSNLKYALFDLRRYLANTNPRGLLPEISQESLRAIISSSSYSEPEFIDLKTPDDERDRADIDEVAYDLHRMAGVRRATVLETDKGYSLQVDYERLISKELRNEVEKLVKSVLNSRGVLE